MGINLGTFPPKHPPGREKIGDRFGVVWGEMGQKQDVFSTSSTLHSHILPSNPPTSPRFLPLSERPTGRIYTKSQVVPFKIKAFSGGIIACTGQEEGAELGRFGGWK